MFFPYLNLERDPSRLVVSKFFDAVCKNQHSAWNFVSRVYSADLDFSELRALLSAGVDHVKIVASASVAKNRTMRSVYVTHNNQRIMLHLSMVQEQGKWKIFGVEQE